MGKDGRWLLWKHRDTSNPENCMRRVEATDSTFGFTALFNTSDTLCREAWIGVNDAGFAVMNTAAYNLTPPARGHADREGIIMAEALSTCRTVSDFNDMLVNYHGKRGVEANFGAFDAAGCGAYFEVDDRQVVVFPVDSLENMLLTRTNYCVSGRVDKRLGVSRFKAESHLLDSLLAVGRPWCDAGRLAPDDFTEVLSRSFYLPSAGCDILDGTAETADDNGDVIPRWSSTASVVIQGPTPESGYDPSTIEMHVILGFPPAGTTIHCTPFSLPPTLTSPDPNPRAAYFRPSSSARSGHAFHLPSIRSAILLNKAPGNSRKQP